MIQFDINVTYIFYEGIKVGTDYIYIYIAGCCIDKSQVKLI